MIEFLLPFIGLCAGTGAVAFIASKTVTARIAPKSNQYESWISQKGKYKQFKPGKNRIVHVSRSAIALNMKNDSQIWPTCIVVDEHNQRHEFHEVFMHSPGKLIFDQDGKNANVYFATDGQISGRNLENQPGKLDENLLSNNSTSTEVDVLRKELENTRKILSQQERQINMLAGEYSETHNIEPGKIQSFVSRISKLEEELRETTASKKALPINPNVNVEEQTILITDKNKCEIKRPLEKGEEGYVDKRKQVKYVRMQYRTIAEKVLPVPLTKDDFGYKTC